jgi:hypothetical protein
MVGLKLGIHPPVIRIKPHVQASAGYLSMRTFSPSIPVDSTNNGTQIIWEILGGIDFPLVHFVDLRLIESGGEQGIDTPALAGMPVCLPSTQGWSSTFGPSMTACNRRNLSGRIPSKMG